MDRLNEYAGDQPQDDNGAPPEPVSVEIYDQVYHLRGTDPSHIERIAGLVDAKMRAVAAQGTTVDSLRVAVLAALNLADELLASRARYDVLAGNAGQTQESMRSRAGELAGMLDEVLGDRRAG
ncbi:MAG: cell division protein ZapA [Acidobacteriota bacterium]|nr:cell division protein ZapA [Acidobacteriota bacterium]